MKPYKFTLLLILLISPLIIFAQEEKKEVIEEKVIMIEKVDKGQKGDNKEAQTIIITRKGVSDDKQNMTMEVKGEKIYINGKLVEDTNKYNDVDKNLMKVEDADYFLYPRGKRIVITSKNFDLTSDKAMLGVTTQKVEGGVEVQSVTKESGAAKAGILEKDIITMIDGDKIEDPDDLMESIQKHKAGDRVVVTLLRDKKQMKRNAGLTKWEGTAAKGHLNMNNFDIDLSDIAKYLPRRPIASRVWAGNGPKLGISVQDREDVKGVKVTGVYEQSNAARAGLKEDDLIIEGEGKAINNVDDMVNLVRQSKGKVSMALKIVRNGKAEDILVKMPRKLRTANL